MMYVYVGAARGSAICYSYEDAAKLLSFNPTISGVELQSSVNGDLNGSLTRQSAAKVNKFCSQLQFLMTEIITIVLTNLACIKLTSHCFLQLDLCRKLIQAAEKILKEETSFYYGIEACNEVLDGYGDEIGPTLIAECLCIRAALLLKVSAECFYFHGFYLAICLLKLYRNFFL